MATTLKEMARELGMSIAGVSLALRNHPKMSVATRERVAELAKERGYVANPALARSAVLAGRKSHGRPSMPLAFVADKNKYHKSCIEVALAEVSRQHGYDMSVFPCDEYPHPQKLGDILWYRGIEAVIFGPISQRNFIENFPIERFSLAAYTPESYNPPCHSVECDIGAAIMRNIEECVQRGYKRIAIARLHEGMPVKDDYERRAVPMYLAKHYEGQVCIEAADFLATGEERKNFISWVRKMRADVVVGLTPLCWWWMIEAGINKKVAFTTLMIDERGDPWEKDLSGTLRDHEKIAKLVVHTLDREVREFQRGALELPARMLVPMAWREGTTLPFRKGRGRNR